ncbi:MAG: hypothetical protein ACRBCK_01340 [Alphaproteobacteria bacterium]
MRKHSEQFLESAVRLRYGHEYSGQMMPHIKNAVVSSGNTFFGISLKKPDPCAYPVRHIKEDALHASDSEPDNYKVPLFNLVYTPSMDESGALLFENTYADKEGSFPGAASQWQMFLLWHEIGHGTGGGEPQSDAISAVVCRQAFEDTTFLRAMADYRMAKVFNCLLRYDGIYAEGMQGVDNYGVPTAEALDHINNLSESSVNALDEDMIRNISFQKFDHCNSVPMNVARRLHYQQLEMGRRRKYNEDGIITDNVLLNYADSARELVSKGGLKVAEEKVLRRAGLAFTCITHGSSSYENNMDLVPDEFFESEKQEPVTFDKGEFMLDPD